MTYRVHSLTVVLDQDIRSDDVEGLIAAIRWHRHVLSVEPHISDAVSHMAEYRAKQELADKLREVLR